MHRSAPQNVFESEGTNASPNTVRCSMWSILPAAAVLLSQAQPDVAEKRYFERRQYGAQLCEGTESACNDLLKINPKITT
jgi:hypothetical protein